MQKNIRLIIDVAMIAAMFFSMSFHLFGVGVHKMIGSLTFILIIVHNILNRKWYKGLLRGTYRPIRVAHTLTNFTVTLAMTGIMVSGVLLSKELARGLDGMTAGRVLHNVSSYIGCIGIALHIGSHLKRRKHYDDQ